MSKNSPRHTTQLQRRTLYAELCWSFKRGHGRVPPLFLSEEEYRHVKDEFVARDAGRHLRRLQLRQTPPRPSSNPLPALDATDELRSLLWPIHRWQGQAVFAANHKQYEEAKAELKQLGKELKRIANALIPPKPRFSKLRGNPEFLPFYAERFFFWTLLHEEYKVLDKVRRNRNLFLSDLKRHYAYLDLPSDFDTAIVNSPHANALKDVGARFNVAADSILSLMHAWLGPRIQFRKKHTRERLPATS